MRLISYKESCSLFSQAKSISDAAYDNSISEIVFVKRKWNKELIKFSSWDSRFKKKLFSDRSAVGRRFSFPDSVH